MGLSSIDFFLVKDERIVRCVLTVQLRTSSID